MQQLGDDVLHLDKLGSKADAEKDGCCCMHQDAQQFLAKPPSNMVTTSSQSSTISLFSPSNQPSTGAVASSSAWDHVDLSDLAG